MYNFLDAYSQISVPTIQNGGATPTLVNVIFSSTGNSIAIAVEPTDTIGSVVSKAQATLGMQQTTNLNVTTDLLPTQTELAAVKNQPIVQLDGSGNQRAITEIRVTAGKLNSNG